MRFGFKTSPQNTTWTDMLNVWKAADQIELFESGWTFDHFYPIHGDSTGTCLEGWTTLAALAQATERLRVGVLVTGIHYRHPAVLANMAAAVDIVSGGRLELGIGAGWNEEESSAYGIELGSLRERFERFDEATQILISLLTQESTTFEGTHYQLHDARNEPKAVQRPHPPICIGGSGEKKTLRMVAKYAQHWNVPAGTPEDFARKHEILKRHCADIGRDPSEITTSTHVPLGNPAQPADPATLDFGQVAETCAQFRDSGLDLAIVYLPSARPSSPGTLEPLANALAQVNA